MAFRTIPCRLECCRELHQYLKLKSKILSFLLCSCRVSVLFSFSATFFKLQVKFPRSPLECHQLSSMAANLEPDTRWGISLPHVSVRQPDSGGPWAEGGAHTAPCRRPTRRPPIFSAPCLRSPPECLPACSHIQHGSNNRGLRRRMYRLQDCVTTDVHSELFFFTLFSFLH